MSSLPKIVFIVHYASYHVMSLLPKIECIMRGIM